MEDIAPLISLKRKKGDLDHTNFKHCLFCQATDTEKLMLRSDEGKERVRVVARERESLMDTTYTSVIERFNNISEADWINANSVKWHKNCYSLFTAENKLQRLRAKLSRLLECKTKTKKLTDCDNEQSKLSRSCCPAVDWNICIFCQATSTVDLHNIATFALSEKIISLSENDLVMSVRLSGISDLIAAEGKYHLKCLVTFERRHSRRMAKPPDEQEDTDIIIEDLCENLVKGLSRGNVYDLGAVWEKYQSMCLEVGVAPPNRYVSRRKTFHDSIQARVGLKGSFIRPLDMKTPLLLYPTEQSKYVIADCLTRRVAKMEDSFEFDKSLPQNTTIEQDIVHTALYIKNELENTPGYSKGWKDVNQESVNKVIPRSLYTFLSVLIGGSSVIDNPHDDPNTVICSIAQDIVFAASKKRKLTPKHIGLGMTLHQATRSEQLINLFHAAGHTIGIDTVRCIDTTIANAVLDEYEANGYVYIPGNIVPYEPGHLILSSCDNIDVLEETIDGKNTLHCTQMVIWQRGPEGPGLRCSNNIGRDTSLSRDRLAMLHKLDYARISSGTRPSPILSEKQTISPETWFNASDERRDAECLNHAWLLSRMSDDGFTVVPSWSGFNAIISKSNSPITSIGMLPILQAPADNYDTITTVLNRFISINQKLGQKYTVIVGNQPLYSRAKELVWATQEMYKNVIVLLGDLHILFNFLKVIGQHLESSGLDDIWVDSGLFAKNSVDTMMNGKSYYRGVRGHMWTYEALYHIWWEMFMNWLTKEKDCKMSSTGTCIWGYREF